MNKIDYQKVIENPSELEFYRDLSKSFLEYLDLYGSSTFWQLVRSVGGSDRRVLRLLDQMICAGLVRFKDGYFNSISNKTNFISTTQACCSVCRGTNVILPDSLRYLIKIMRDVYEKRPKPTFIFDQRPVTIDTTIQRVAYLISRGDLQGKKIVVIGDDDLTSIALGLSKLAKQITVFDIDKRLIIFLRKYSGLLGLNLEVVHCDITKGIPSEYHNQFDVFLTDPTPMPVPFTIFINSGIIFLKNKLDKIGYTSIYSSGMKQSMIFQKILTEMGFLITDVVPKFTEYEFIKETYSENDLKLLKKYEYKKDRLSFFESLIRIETTPDTYTKPIKVTLKDIFGSATKRILANPEKDPSAFEIKQYRTYIHQATKLMLSRQNQQIISGQRKTHIRIKKMIR